MKRRDILKSIPVAACATAVPLILKNTYKIIDLRDEKIFHPALKNYFNAEKGTKFISNFGTYTKLNDPEEIVVVETDHYIGRKNKEGHVVILPQKTKITLKTHDNGYSYYFNYDQVHRKDLYTDKVRWYYV